MNLTNHSFKRLTLIDNCYRDCHKKYFCTFEYKGDYDIQLTNITNSEIFNLKISDKNMGLYELN